MSEEMDTTKMLKVLNWSYDKALNGLPGLETAEQMAEDYLKLNKPLIGQVNSLIRWQNTKCATSGFVTGLGGIITLPVSMPANLASVLYVQLRMIAAIAYMGGYDIRDDRVRTLSYVCLTGTAATDILKGMGYKLGTKFAKTAINNISGKTLIEINKKVGFRLVTKFGEKGVFNFGKMAPILGGIIGAAIDSVSTNTIGNVARKTFIDTPQ
jgi:hypothetical protein